MNITHVLLTKATVCCVKFGLNELLMYRANKSIGVIFTMVIVLQRLLIAFNSCSVLDANVKFVRFWLVCFVFLCKHDDMVYCIIVDIVLPRKV